MRANYIGILMCKTSKNKGSKHSKKAYYNSHTQEFYKPQFHHAQN